MFFYSLLKPSSCFTYVYFTTTAGYTVTMDDSVVIGIVSLTLVRCDLSVLPDLNAVLMSKSLHTLWMLSLNPAMYRIVRIQPFSCSVFVWSLEGNSLEPALMVPSRNLAVYFLLLYHHGEFDLSWPLKRTSARSQNVGLSFNKKYWLLKREKFPIITMYIVNIGYSINIKYIQNLNGKHRI